VCEKNKRGENMNAKRDMIEILILAAILAAVLIAIILEVRA